MRPGLTGLTQVYAPRDISRTSKFRLDRLYLKRAGLLARPEVDSAVVLDHRPRRVGEARIAGSSVGYQLTQYAPYNAPVECMSRSTSSSWAAARAGLFMAARLAGRGVRRVVCEEHARVGDPVHCTGVLSSDSFGALRSAARRDAQSADRRCGSSRPAASRSTTRRRRRSRRSSIAPAFDRALADRALAAGAEIRVGARVIGARRRCRRRPRHRRRRKSCSARLAVLACGAQLRLPAALRLRPAAHLSAHRAARAAG